MTKPKTISDTSCRTALKTETEHFVIDLHTDPLSLKHACRDSGWCTKYIFSATSYCLMGPLWTIRKRGKNRPSYLFWKNQCTDLVSFAYDFRHRQNSYVEPLEFIAKHPELRHWLATAISTDYQPDFDRECLREVMLEDGMVEVALGDSPERRHIAEQRLKRMITGFVEHGNPFPEPHQAQAVFEEISMRRHSALSAMERPCLPDSPFPAIDNFGIGRRVRRLGTRPTALDHPDYHRDQAIGYAERNGMLGHYPRNPTEEHANLRAQQLASEYMQSQERARMQGWPPRPVEHAHATAVQRHVDEMRTGRNDAEDAVDRFMRDFAGVERAALLRTSVSRYENDSRRETRRHSEMRLFNDVVGDMMSAATPPPEDWPESAPTHPSVTAGHQNLHQLMEQSLRSLGQADIERDEDGDIVYYNSPIDAEDLRQIADRYQFDREAHRPRDSPKRWTESDRVFFRLATMGWWLAGSQAALIAYALTTGLGYG